MHAHLHLWHYLRAHWQVILKLFVGLALPLLGFTKIAEDVFDKEPFAFEAPLMLAIHAHSSAFLNHVAATFSLLGSARGMVPIVLVLVVVLYRVRRRLAWFALVSLVGVALVNVVLKSVFDRPRPTLWTPFLPEPDFSFPSGHAMFASALACTVVAILWPTRWRVLAIVLGSLYVLGMMLSRVYIGVHYPTDVAGGALFSVAWVVGLARLVRAQHVLETPRGERRSGVVRSS